MPETHNSGSIRRRCNGRSRWANFQRTTQEPAPPPVIQPPKPAPTPQPAEQELFELGPMPERVSVPFQQIVAAYHAQLPMLPRVRTLSEDTRKKVRSRWTEDVARQNMDWWEQFFAYCATRGHLTGNNDRGWAADFRWLMCPTNMEKVINGYYKEHARA